MGVMEKIKVRRRRRRLGEVGEVASDNHYVSWMWIIITLIELSNVVIVSTLFSLVYLVLFQHATVAGDWGGNGPQWVHA